MTSFPIYESCDHFGTTDANILSYGDFTAPSGTPFISTQGGRKCIGVPIGGELRKTAGTSVPFGLTAPDSFTTAFWFQLSALPVSGSHSIFQTDPFNAGVSYSVVISNTGFINFSGYTATFSGAGLIAAGNWYCVKISFQTRTGASSSSQSMTVSNSAGTTIFSGTTSFTSTVAGAVSWVSFFGIAAGIVYFDDMGIINDHAIISTHPIYSNGSAQQWSGAGSHAARIETTFNDGTTTEITSAASGLIETFNLAAFPQNAFSQTEGHSLIIDGLGVGVTAVLKNNITSATLSMGTHTTTAGSYGAATARSVPAAPVASTGFTSNDFNQNLGNISLILTSNTASAQSISAVYLQSERQLPFDSINSFAYVESFQRYSTGAGSNASCQFYRKTILDGAIDDANVTIGVIGGKTCAQILTASGLVVQNTQTVLKGTTKGGQTSFWFRVSALPASGTLNILVFNGSGNGTATLALQNNGTMTFSGWNGVSNVASSIGAIAANTWYHIALKFRFDVSPNGHMSLYINGASVGTPVIGGATKPVGASTADTARLEFFQYASATLYVTDIIFADLGLPFPGVDGNTHIIAPLALTSDGSTDTWTPSTGSTHFNLVNDTTLFAPSTFVLQDTTYVQSTVTGRIDEYTLGALSGIPNIIYGVSTDPVVSSNTSGSGTVAVDLVTVSGGVSTTSAQRTVAHGPTFGSGLANPIAYFPVDPSGAAWANGAFSSSGAFKVKLTSGGTNTLKLYSLPVEVIRSTAGSSSLTLAAAISYPSPRFTTGALQTTTLKTVTAAITYPSPRVATAAVSRASSRTLTVSGTLPGPRTTTAALMRAASKLITSAGGTLPHPRVSSASIYVSLPKTVAAAAVLPHPRSTTAVVQRNGGPPHTLTAAIDRPAPRKTTAVVTRSADKTITSVVGVLPHPRLSAATLFRVGYKIFTAGLTRPGRSSDAALNIIGTKTLTASGTYPSPRQMTATMVDNTLRVLTVAGIKSAGRFISASLTERGPRSLTIAGTRPSLITTTATIRTPNHPRFMMIITTV